jgi:hypothetical protein
MLIKAVKFACKMSMSTSSLDKCTYLEEDLTQHIETAANATTKYLTTEPRMNIEVTDSK